jgi:hypothetical protein
MKNLACIPHLIFSIDKPGIKIAPSFTRLTRTTPFHLLHDKHMQAGAANLRQEGADF